MIAFCTISAEQEVMTSVNTVIYIKCILNSLSIEVFYGKYEWK